MGKHIVIFDGDCGICEKTRRLAQRLDWCKTMEFLPLQDEAIYKDYPQLTREACEKEIKLIEENTKTYGGGDAMIRIGLKLPLTMIPAWIAWLPPFRQIVRWAYPKFADNRYRFSRACGIPNKNEQTQS